MYCYVLLLALIGSECVSVILFTMLENEEEGSVGKLCFKFQSLQNQGHKELPGKPSWCLLIQYLSLSIMHVLPLKFYKNLIIKTIFDVEFTTILYIGYYHASS